MSVEFVHLDYDLIKEEDVGDADTAIYVLSRKAGEGYDESVTNGWRVISNTYWMNFKAILIITFEREIKR